MKDLTKGKPSVLVFTFAVPIFLGNLLQLTYSLADTRIVGSFLGGNALAAVGATSTLSGLIIGFLLGLSNGFCHYHGTEIRRRRYRTNAEIICPVVSSWNRNFGILYCAWTCISATNSAILKYTGKIAANGKILHYYYHSRAACNLFI